MKIQAKFEIGDILAVTPNMHKDIEALVTGANGVGLQKVQEIHSQTCYAGSQVFYLTSAIHVSFEKQFRREANKTTVLVASASYNTTTPGLHGAWMKYREDELEKVDLDKFVDKCRKELKKQADAKAK